MPDLHPEGQDAREWTIRWEWPVRKHVLVGPVDGRQMEGLVVVPKARLVGSEARQAELEAALREARADVVGVLNAGFDSTRREVATRAIARIDAALTEVVDQTTGG